MSTQSDLKTPEVLVTDHQPSPPPDWGPTLTGEMLLFSLLGKLLYTYPDRNQREWLQSLAEDDVFGEAPFGAEQPDVRAGLAHLARWSQANRGGLSAEAMATLEADYNRLFVGPGRLLAPPWESTYFSEERLLFQEQTLAVRRWYQRFGLEITNLYNEPDDHIGLELAFMAHLAQRGLIAAEAGDQPALDLLMAAQRDFLAHHLLQWAPIWCEQVDEHAQTDFYRGLALLVRGGLAEIAAIVGLQMPDGDQQ